MMIMKKRGHNSASRYLVEDFYHYDTRRGDEIVHKPYTAQKLGSVHQLYNNLLDIGS